jgi:molybdopterin-guanine dinucleotide biosynthesis protein A
VIENNILGVVLAGGKSQRFGSDKSSIKLGDKSLIEHAISKIENNFQEILIISNNEINLINKKNIFLTKDLIGGFLGPLVGVLSAMDWVEKKKKNYKWVATFPCDTPFFDQNLIEKLKNCTVKTSKKLIFIKSGNKRHNIFGLWSMELKEILLKDINNGFRKVEDWANKIGSEIVEINSDNDYNFLNINTKEDLEEARNKIK